MHFNPIKPESILPSIQAINWPVLNAEWENCKESQPAFCKRKNINLNTFTYWRSKFISQKNKKSKLTSSFVPVKIKAENISISLPLIIENRSGVKIIIPGNVSAHQLSDILKLVGFNHAEN
jgi:hypothetical protein